MPDEGLWECHRIATEKRDCRPETTAFVGHKSLKQIKQCLTNYSPVLGRL